MWPAGSLTGAEPKRSLYRILARYSDHNACVALRGSAATASDSCQNTGVLCHAMHAALQVSRQEHWNYTPRKVILALGGAFPLRSSAPHTASVFPA